MAPMNLGQYRQTLRSEWLSPPFYRDLVAEFICTFLLTLSSTHLGLSWGKENMGTPLQSSWFMGFAVCSLAWGQAEFGGIHMNPVVTFAMTILGEITFTRAIVYVGIQISAALCGVLFVKTIYPAYVTDPIKPTVLHAQVEPWQGFLTEIWLTFYLVLVVLGSSDGHRRECLYVPPLIIAMTVSTCISSGSASTGCSMNPALTMGPAIVTGIWDDHWLYWAGPLTGTCLAVLVYKVLFDMVDNKGARPSPRAQWYSMHINRQTGKRKTNLNVQICKSSSVGACTEVRKRRGHSSANGLKTNTLVQK